MDALALTTHVTAAGPRPACSDAERRTAVWARNTLREGGHDARLETHWVRPAWQLSLALQTGLAAAGSLLSVWQAEAGFAVLAAVTLSLAAELTGRLRPLRLLTPARATQNVIVEPPPGSGRPRLVITANLDAGRPSALSSAGWRAVGARLRRRFGANLPPPAAWLVAVLVLLGLTAGLRISGSPSQAVQVVQFALTLVVVVTCVGLVDGALSAVSPGANVNASGLAVVMSLADELADRRLTTIEVELVLAGAGDRDGLGLEQHIRARRRTRRAEDVVVLAVEACGAGQLAWRERDGRLVPLRMHPGLCALMATAAAGETHLGARPQRSWQAGGAYTARRLGWPAIAVGAVAADGLPARAHQPGDTADRLEANVLEAVIELSLAFVGAVDAELTKLRADAPRPALPGPDAPGPDETAAAPV